MKLNRTRNKILHIENRTAQTKLKPIVISNVQKGEHSILHASAHNVDFWKAVQVWWGEKIPMTDGVQLSWVRKAVKGYTFCVLYIGHRYIIYCLYYFFEFKITVYENNDLL